MKRVPFVGFAPSVRLVIMAGSVLIACILADAGHVPAQSGPPLRAPMAPEVQTPRPTQPQPPTQPRPQTVAPPGPQPTQPAPARPVNPQREQQRGYQGQAGFPKQKYAYRPDLTNPQYGQCLKMEEQYWKMWEEYNQLYQTANTMYPGDPRYARITRYLQGLSQRMNQAWSAFSSRCIYFPESQ